MVPRSMPMFIAVFVEALFDFDLGGRDDIAFVPGAIGGRSIFSAFQPLWRNTPPGALPLTGTLPKNFTVAGVRIDLGKTSFYAVDHRRQAQVAVQRISALFVQIPSAAPT